MIASSLIFTKIKNTQHLKIFLKDRYNRRILCLKTWGGGNVGKEYRDRIKNVCIP